MSNIFQRYFDKHGHGPRVSVLSGIQKITVEFSPGYITISSSSPYQAKIYVTRSAAIQLLKKMVPLARVMAKNPHPDHDVPQAMRAAYHEEMQHLQALRLEKKTRDRPAANEAHERQRRQRQRFLRAQERARRRAAEEDE